MNKEYDFELLVHKNLTNQITDEERNYLNLQLEDESSKLLADELSKIWNESKEIAPVSFNKDKAKQAFFNQINVEKKVEIIQLNKDYAPRNNRRWLYYATAIASMFLIGFFAINNLSKNADVMTFASADISQNVSLPDGSKIILAANSTLSYNKNTFNSSRVIDLKGTALFEVAKTGNSFVVETPNYKVEVLGTTFTVDATKENQEVKVLEGKVRVKTSASKELIITDRQGATIKNDEIQKIDNIDFSDDKWIEPEMTYDNTPLSKVVSDIETKFGVKFSFRPNHNIQSCNFSSGGSLKEVTLSQLITIIESALDAKIEKKEANVYAFQTLNCK